MTRNAEQINKENDVAKNSVEQTPEVTLGTENSLPLGAIGTNRPNKLTPSNILALQRTVGNRAVQRILQKNRPSSPAIIQRKDYEQTNDATLNYGPFSQEIINGRHKLNKAKTVYKDKVKNNETLGELEEGRLVKVGTGPVSNGGRSWYQVTAKINNEDTTGWINTKNALESTEDMFQHEDGGIIMEAEPTVEDIKQNMFGDCFLLAPLLSLTRRDPDFVKTKLFASDPTKPAKEHLVRFHKPIDNGAKFQEDIIKVQNTVLTTTKDFTGTGGDTIKAGNLGSNGAQQWPAIIEKAFAVWGGKDRDSLSGGAAVRGSMYLTGEAYGTISLKLTAGEQRNFNDQQKEDWHAARKNHIINGLKEKGILSISTPKGPSDEWKQKNPNAEESKGGSGEGKLGGIAFGHVYELVSADENSVSLRNPWGKYSRVNGEIKEDAAVSILTWEEFFIIASDIALKKELSEIKKAQ